jgi:hypothetical protein
MLDVVFFCKVVVRFLRHEKIGKQENSAKNRKRIPSASRDAMLTEENGGDDSMMEL